MLCHGKFFERFANCAIVGVARHVEQRVEVDAGATAAGDAHAEYASQHPHTHREHLVLQNRLFLRAYSHHAHW
jgi:hypothetical protein